MIYIFLMIEFLDELVFGVGETAWPYIRDDLNLTYTQIGLLLSLPGILAAFIEPWIGILGDVWRRRFLILFGGTFFTLSLALTAASTSFTPLLISFIVFSPSSGAFVNLSQASLMDAEPSRHEQNMARWTFAGSAGVLTGPLLLGLFIFLGLGWRKTYILLASGSIALLFWGMKYIPRDGNPVFFLPSPGTVVNGFRNTINALKRRDVWRWLLLLDFADLMMDVLLSFLALYFVDVAGVSEGLAAAGVAIWLAAGLITDLIFIPIIDRQPDSIRYLRLTALLEVFAFTMFLLLPGFILKVMALVFVNVCNTGWYSILQGRLYTSLPGQSASIMAISSITAPLARSFPLFVGFLADAAGLHVAIWFLLLGPLALIIGLPKRRLVQRT